MDANQSRQVQQRQEKEKIMAEKLARKHELMKERELYGDEEPVLVQDVAVGQSNKGKHIKQMI
jgi:hypothetical protein